MFITQFPNTLKNLILLFLLALSYHTQAQDRMVLRSNPKDTLLVKVEDLGFTEITYRLWPIDQDMPVTVENKGNILYLKLENGEEYTFKEEEILNDSAFVGNKTRIIKTDLVSFLYNSLSFSFEKSLNLKHSYEIGLGLIGLGVNTEQTPPKSGFFIRAGYKNYISHNFNFTGKRPPHILTGFYLRPEVVSKYFKQELYSYSMQYSTDIGDYKYYRSLNKNTTFGIGFIFNAGKQWVYNNNTCLELFAGGGLGYTKINTKSYKSEIPSNEYYNQENHEVNDMNGYGEGYLNYNENIIKYGNKIGLLFQMGFKFGILLR